MEQFHVEQQSRPKRSWYQIVRPSLRVFSNHTDGPVDGTRDRTISWNNGDRLINLRKYSMAICMIEALVITFLIYLLMRLPAESDRSTSPRPSNQPGDHSGLNQSCRTYRSIQDPNVEVTFMAGLVPGCNQRRHDQANSVHCKSSQIELCRPPFSPAARPEQLRNARHVQVIETSRSGSRMEHSWRQVQELDCEFGNGSRELDKLCRLGTRIESFHPSLGRQKIVGWGGALSDSTINNILSLSVNGTRRLMDDYFGADGLMFNMARVTIGGSDFSARFYTNRDEEVNFSFIGKVIPGGDKFSLMEEDYLYKIPLLRMVVNEYNFKGREIKLFASMWSPPVWMKTNRHFNKGQLRGSINDKPIVRGKEPSEERYFQWLAKLKLEWLSRYREHKIKFWGLTVMNEPIFAVQPFLNFNTMIFPRDDYANYIVKYLGPELKSRDETRHIKLMIHDDNRRYLLNYTKPILDQPLVRQYVDGVSVHGYIDHEYDMMDIVYETYKSPGLDRAADDWFVLPTELCSGHLPFMEKALIGNWQRGVHYALDIIHSLQHSAAGWIDWNMALDLEGGPGWLGGRLDAPIIVDKATDSYHKSPMFYVLGQFSRFIPPNSQRLDIRVLNQSYDNLFEVVAFVVPGEGARPRITVVVVNDNPYEVELLTPSGLGFRNSKFYPLKVSPDSITTVVYDL